MHAYTCVICGGVCDVGIRGYAYTYDHCDRRRRVSARARTAPHICGCLRFCGVYSCANVLSLIFLWFTEHFRFIACACVLLRSLSLSAILFSSLSLSVCLFRSSPLLLCVYAYAPHCLLVLSTRSLHIHLYKRTASISLPCIMRKALASHLSV